MVRTLALAAVLLTAPTVSGPPWISIEYPPNPHDASTRDAFLLVRAFHHGTPTAFPVEGTAEGIVSGERRTVRLEFGETTRTGVYALNTQWPDRGTWTLVIRVVQGANDAATAVVELGADGAIASVRVPTTRQGRWTIPAPVSMAEIDAALRARAAALARRG